jgi:hypothetical protein
MADRSWAWALPSRSAGNQTDTHALPDTPARVTTGRSRLVTTMERGPASGTETALSRTSPMPVYTSALTNPMVLRSDSANCSRSSSIGMARVNRLPKVRRTSSGACRAP